MRLTSAGELKALVKLTKSIDGKGYDVLLATTFKHTGLDLKVIKHIMLVGLDAVISEHDDIATKQQTLNKGKHND